MKAQACGKKPSVSGSGVYRNVGELIDHLLDLGWRNISFRVKPASQDCGGFSYNFDMLIISGDVPRGLLPELYYELYPDGRLSIPVPF